MSIKSKFIIAYFLSLIILFIIFYWGEYWNYSIIGDYIDKFHRDIIMKILLFFVNDPVVDKYDILLDNRTKLMITPECNGLIPFLIIEAAILAAPTSIKCKIIWSFVSYIIFMIANILRLIIVYLVVKKFGVDSFFLIHDVIGNIFLIIVGIFLFFKYLDKCND